MAENMPSCKVFVLNAWNNNQLIYYDDRKQFIYYLDLFLAHLNFKNILYENMFHLYQLLSKGRRYFLTKVEADE